MVSGIERDQGRDCPSGIPVVSSALSQLKSLRGTVNELLLKGGRESEREGMERGGEETGKGGLKGNERIGQSKGQR